MTSCSLIDGIMSCLLVMWILCYVMRNMSIFMLYSNLYSWFNVIKKYNVVLFRSSNGIPHMDVDP